MGYPAFKDHKAIGHGCNYNSRLSCCIALAAMCIQLQSWPPSVSHVINAQLATMFCRIPARIQVQDGSDRAAGYRI